MLLAWYVLKIKIKNLNERVDRMNTSYIVHVIVNTFLYTCVIISGLPPSLTKKICNKNSLYLQNRYAFNAFNCFFRNDKYDVFYGETSVDVSLDILIDLRFLALKFGRMFFMQYLIME